MAHWIAYWIAYCIAYWIAYRIVCGKLPIGLQLPIGLPIGPDCILDCLLDCHPRHTRPLPGVLQHLVHFFVQHQLSVMLFFPCHSQSIAACTGQAVDAIKTSLKVNYKPQVN